MACAWAAMPAHAGGFLALDLRGSQLVGLSADGRVAAGTLVGATNGGFRWREGRAVELLDGAVSVSGLSASGDRVAGSSFNAAQEEIASYWDAAGRLHVLGGLPGSVAAHGVLSAARGISDQERVVGIANGADDRPTAFAWDAKQGLQPLPVPGGARWTSVHGLSADGRHAYGGYATGDGIRHGLVWDDGSLRSTQPIPIPSIGEVLGANSDASLLIGSLDGDGDVARPYRWRGDVGAQPLPGFAAGLPQPLRPLAASEDGRIIVGSAGAGGDRVAILWLGNGVPQRLDAVMAARGIALQEGWTLAAATGVSSDGRRLCGWGRHRDTLDSFVVDLGQ